MASICVIDWLEKKRAWTQKTPWDNADSITLLVMLLMGIKRWPQSDLTGEAVKNRPAED